MQNLLKKRVLALFFLLFASSLSLYAANVSFIVLETGNSAAAAAGSAALWEDGIMDVFFEGGHIISNARSKKIGAVPKTGIPEEALIDFQEASEGGSQYFMVALLNYGKSNPDEFVTPESVTLRLYALSPNRLITEKTVKETNKTPVEDEFNTAKRTAQAMLPFIGRKQ